MPVEKEIITLAVPVFEGRVSPRLDCASQMLIVHLQNGKIRDIENCNLKMVKPYQLAGFLLEKGVHKVICYHLCRRDWYTLKANGIDVLPRISGPVDEAISQYTSGQLSFSTAQPFWRQKREGRCSGMDFSQHGRRGRRWHHEFERKTKRKQKKGE